MGESTGLGSRAPSPAEPPDTTAGLPRGADPFIKDNEGSQLSLGGGVPGGDMGAERGLLPGPHESRDLPGLAVRPGDTCWKFILEQFL